MDDLTGRDIYAIVSERDGLNGDGRPIIWEQFIDGDSASLAEIKKRRTYISTRYGKTWIVKLQFIEESEADNA